MRGICPESGRKVPSLWIYPRTLEEADFRNQLRVWLREITPASNGVPRRFLPSHRIGHTQGRPIEICGEIARIPLTRGRVAIIDACDIPLVQDVKWSAWESESGPVYAARSSYRKRIFMHRLIFGAKSGDPIVDHKDRDGLNNRRSNLRFADKFQSRMNASHPNKCGFRGVSPVGNKWTARIVARGVPMYIGIFDSTKEAAKAYDNAAKIHHREFAILNFP